MQSILEKRSKSASAVIVKKTSKNALDHQKKLWNGLLRSAGLVYR
jgi:hypothetical protein